MNEYLPDFHKVTKLLTWIVIVILILGSGYLIFVSANSFRFRPQRIVERFISLIENPTQTVTDSEKEELQAITQSGFFSNWGNENNIRTLRRVSQGNPINYTDIEFTGESRRTAQSTLQFENDFTNEDSKQAVLYLERIGNFWTGVRWQIFKIDMPREDNPIDEAREFGEDLQENINEGTQNILDRIRNIF